MSDQQRHDISDSMLRPQPVWKMPILFTSFIGREQEVADICALFKKPEIRLLTILGPGGVGKTRLSVQVATELRDSFTDGICFIHLAAIYDHKLVVSAIAEGLETREIGAQALIEQVKLSLHDRCLLLVLDNFEQVSAATPQIEELLIACPSLKILVTSRVVLHMQGEQEFPVSPLSLPNLKQLPEGESLLQCASVALFVQRARAVLPSFQINSTNARTLPERQQTLRNTLKWSYDLLDGNEQRLFRRLSIFVGGWTLEAAEAVWNARAEGETGNLSVLDSVASLLDKSLLFQVEQEGEEPRLIMLETVREFGLECLSASGEDETIRLAHAAYFLELAEKLETMLTGPQQAMCLRQLEREYDNLRTALHWLLREKGDGHNIENALRLGGALQHFWFISGHYSEGRYFLGKALASSDTISIPVRAKGLETNALLALDQGDYDAAQMLAEEGLEFYRKLRDTRGTAKTLLGLGQIATARSNYSTARSLLEESLILYKETGDQERNSCVLAALGSVACQSGEYDGARALYEESLAINRELDNGEGIANSLMQLAQVFILSKGDSTVASSLLEEGRELFSGLGHKMSIATCIHLSGVVSFWQDNPTKARALLEESVVRYKELGDKWNTAEALATLARIEAHQGKPAVAQTLFAESLNLAEEVSDKTLIAFGLEGMAGMLATQGEPARAVRLWGTAEALREAAGAPIPPFWRSEYKQSVAAARASLGEEAFAFTLAEGRSMTLEQALAARDPTILPATAPFTTQPTSARLTRRELEVLRLLAQGLTNPQIAEQLIVSLPTINTHVASIFNKLDVTTRSAATRYAVEQHLA